MRLLGAQKEWWVGFIFIFVFLLFSMAFGMPTLLSFGEWERGDDGLPNFYNQFFNILYTNIIIKDYWEGSELIKSQSVVAHK